MDLYAFVATKINAKKVVSCHEFMEGGYERQKPQCVYEFLKIPNAYVVSFVKQL